MSNVSVVLSMRTMIDRNRIGDMNAIIGFRFGEEEFRALLKGGDFTIDRGFVEGADVVLSGDQNALAAVVYGGASFNDVAGALQVEGDHALAVVALRQAMRHAGAPQTAPSGHMGLDADEFLAPVPRSIHSFASGRLASRSWCQTPR